MIKKSWFDIFLLIGGVFYVVALSAWVAEYPASQGTNSTGVSQQTRSGTRDHDVRPRRTSQRVRNEEATIVRVVWLNTGIPRERFSQGLFRRTPSTFCDISGAELSDWF